MWRQLVQLCGNQTRAGRFQSALSTMFKKMFTAVAVLAVGCYGFVACNHDASVPPGGSPVSLSTNSSQSVATNYADDETSTDDIIDDYELGARAAAAIDTANQVKYRIKVTGSCSTTGSASFKYVEGTSTASVLSTTAASSANGFKSFSVAPAKFNVELLKTFDKTKSYTIYAKIPGEKKTATMPAIPVTYKLVTTLSPNPAAEKALNKAGTKRTGRPITTATTTLGCPM